MVQLLTDYTDKLYILDMIYIIYVQKIARYDQFGLVKPD